MLSPCSSLFIKLADYSNQCVLVEGALIPSCLNISAWLVCCLLNKPSLNLTVFNNFWLCMQSWPSVCICNDNSSPEIHGWNWLSWHFFNPVSDWDLLLQQLWFLYAKIWTDRMCSSWVCWTSYQCLIPLPDCINCFKPQSYLLPAHNIQHCWWSTCCLLWDGADQRAQEGEVEIKTPDFHKSP